MKSIIILESDPFTDATLTELIQAEGYDVLDVRNETSLLQVLEQQEVGAAFVDVESPDWGAHSVVSSIRAVAPETPVILTAGSSDAPGLQEGRKAGADGQLLSPYDKPTVLALLQRLAPILRGEASASRGDMDTAATASAQPSSPTSRTDQNITLTGTQALTEDVKDTLRRFLDSSLQTFIQIEQETLSARRELLLSRGMQEGASDEVLRTWIAHPDARFTKGIRSIEERARVQIVHTMTTGGEILDRLGSSRADLILLSDQLPDIPTEIVLESLSSSDSGTIAVVIQNWDSDRRSAEIRSSGSDPIQVALDSVDDLLRVLDLARARSAAATMGREFAKTFRQRHQAFLRDYTRLKEALARS